MVERSEAKTLKVVESLIAFGFRMSAGVDQP